MTTADITVDPQDVNASLKRKLSTMLNRKYAEGDKRQLKEVIESNIDGVEVYVE